MFDIGAVEMLLQPAAVWLAGGGPAAIYAGQPLTIRWQMPMPDGQRVRLKIYRAGVYQMILGAFNVVNGIGSVTLTLPGNLLPGEVYTIRGTSVTNAALNGWTAPFALLSPKNGAQNWLNYE